MMSRTAQRPFAEKARLAQLNTTRHIAVSVFKLPVLAFTTLALIALLLTGAGCADMNFEPKPQQPVITPAARSGTYATQAYGNQNTGYSQDASYHKAAGYQTAEWPANWSDAEKQGATFISSAPIYFYYDSSRLTDSAKAVLQQKAAKLNEFPGFFVSIGGHCDERGSAAYNDALGAKRARAALEYLAQQGVARARLEAVSYGKSSPLAPGHGESVWSRNRRAEFSVSKK